MIEPTMSDAKSSGSNLDTGDVTGLAHVNVPGAVDVSHGIILYLEDVSVSFDGFKALNRLSLWMESDELRCIIGPNVAVKT
jgi:urea transport system ATP-binding protein